jgi:hypothetical protein
MHLPVRVIDYMKRAPVELLVWLFGLTALYFMDPGGPSLCLLKRAGIPWCPGCGLGHSIHHLLHGHWEASFRSHPLGFFAVAVLGSRIINLGKQRLQAFHQHKKTYTS